MRVVENANAKSIVEMLIPKEVLELNPVIAGGFIVSLYQLAIRHSNKKFDDDLLIKLKRVGPQSMWGSVTLENLGLHKRFGDIDLWFTEDSDIWEGEGKDLLMDFVQDIQKVSSSILYADTINRSFYEASKVFNSELIKYRLGSNINNSTYWANSFDTNLKDVASLPIQFIKKKYKDIDELFSKFDLINCCAAYQDGKFYFHDDFEASHDAHTLEAGGAFSRNTEISKIWVSMRAFKYSKRFSWEFSKDICNVVTEVMMDAGNIQRLIDKGQYNLRDKTIDLSSLDALDDPYGRNGVVSIDKLSGMIKGLLGNFGHLIRMNNFDEDKVLLFVNSQHHSVKSEVEAYIKKKTEEYNIARGIITPKKEPQVDKLDSLFDDIIAF
jgi:hypothetical protein